MTKSQQSRDTAHQTVATIGEFALIDQLAATLAESGAATAPDLLGIGDDAAIWTPTPNTRAVITTDSLIEGIHFRRDWTSWDDLGHKALAVNLSDIAAMGAQPKLATISLALTGQECVADLQALYHGLGHLAAQYQVIIAGGDIVSSPERLGLHITVVGESWPEAAGRLLTRDSAVPGDLLAVSGPLGLSAAGLRRLLQPPVSSTAADAAFLQAHHHPEPRIAFGRILIAAGVRTAMDLSDGLAGDLAKICQRSNVGAQVEQRRLPVPTTVRQAFPHDWVTLATRGGEDYELLFACPPETLTQLQRLLPEAKLPVPTVIGVITAPPRTGPPIQLILPDGITQPLGGGAFDHFNQAP